MGVNAIDKLTYRDKGGPNCWYMTGATTSSDVTGSTTNNFGKIVFLTSGTLTSITSTQINGSTNWSSASTIAAGTVILAKVTKVKTKTGCYLMYLNSELPNGV